METNGKPLPVQHILSVYPGVDRSHSTPSDYILVELQTARGLLVLKTPQPLAQSLAEGLSRAAEGASARWVPEYRAADR